MRKVLIVSVSVLALSAGAAFGQSAAPSNFASPSTISAGTNQIGGGSLTAGNKFYVDQVGAGNQIGSGTTGGVNQQVLSGTSYNYSEVYQGYQSTQSNYGQATVNQTASAGGVNKSRIVQYDNSGAPNISFTGGNIASATQIVTVDGATNASTIEQTGSTNWANVTQGSAGDSTVTPAISPSGGGATSTLSQNGSSLTASVTQTSVGAVSAIYQSGTGNGLKDAAANVVINQHGLSSNNSGVYQASTTTANGTVTVEQYGASGVLNTSDVWQTSGSSMASVTQSGTVGLNTSYLNQNGGGINNATVIQTASTDGAENYSAITQSGGATAYVTSDLEQRGQYINSSAIGRKRQQCRC